MGGCALIVLVGVLEKVSGKSIPLSAYLALVALLFCTACYLAWRDAQKRLADLSSEGAFKREFLADRLRTLLHDAEEAIKADNARSSVIFMEALTGFLPIRNRAQIQLFLQTYYDAETLERFNENGLPVIEDLLADCYRDNK